MHFDVIIIGAGAAGLAAGYELASHDCRALILEARDRTGGRCWSRSEPGWVMPIEMGAEFIHGRPATTFSFLDRFGIPAIERTGSRWSLRDGRVEPRARDAILAHIRETMLQAAPPQRDISFRAYVDDVLRDRLSQQERTFALRMVEGYDAADPNIVSAQAIVEEWIRESTTNDVTFRPHNGYSALMAALERALERSTVFVRLRTVVRTVRWQHGQVAVEGATGGEPFLARAARVIVTLPLGVLQLSPTVPGAVHFVPGLEEKRHALAALTAGPVLRIALRFQTAFWEQIDGGRYRDAGFLQSADAPFPTFWTSLPARAPILIAWAGGPRAARMADLADAQKIQRAVASLDTLFGARAVADARFEAALAHDWQADPYACGAYSSVNVRGTGARKALAAPLAGTLFFAGEATDFTGEAATVAGAFQSGIRAAREVLQT